MRANRTSEGAPAPKYEGWEAELVVMEQKKGVTVDRELAAKVVEKLALMRTALIPRTAASRALEAAGVKLSAEPQTLALFSLAKRLRQKEAESRVEDMPLAPRPRSQQRTENPPANAVFTEREWARIRDGVENDTFFTAGRPWERTSSSNEERPEG